MSGRKSKNPAFKQSFLSVDLTGIEPVSLRVKGSMLTHYTTGPGPRNYYTTKKALLQELSLLTRN